jgi:hypothetical protein
MNYLASFKTFSYSSSVKFLKISLSLVLVISLGRVVGIISTNLLRLSACFISSSV